MSIKVYLVNHFYQLGSFFCSGWIETHNINPYNEHKEQMTKLGKSKPAFKKAIVEIEAVIADPNVSLMRHQKLFYKLKF